jgi:DNA-binding NarL/FixJ family response regulator
MLAVPLGKLLRSVRLEHPKASVIVLGKESSTEYYLELLFLGVVGFVAYDHVPDELPRAIRSVARGGVWMTADAVEELGRQRRLLAGRRHGGSLTRREMTVLGLLQRGFCNKEIASALGVSVSTVKFHLTNIFTKSGFHDRLRAAQSLPACALPRRAAAGATPSRASGLSQQPAR